jgi:hypothetical protein
MAREGKKVMQFLSDRRYIAHVVDGGCRFMDAAVAVKEPTRRPAKRRVAGRATSVVRDGEDGPIVV